MKIKASSIMTVEDIEKRIIILREQRVIINADLAVLYGVTAKRLNEQVRQNIERFPSDFVFQMTLNEKRDVIAKCDHLFNLRFSHSAPLAFTIHGAIMAANVIYTSQAVDKSIMILRTFIKLSQSHGFEILLDEITEKEIA